jgi:hypothetical protein
MGKPPLSLRVEGRLGHHEARTSAGSHATALTDYGSNIKMPNPYFTVCLGSSLSPFRSQTPYAMKAATKIATRTPTTIILTSKDSSPAAHIPRPPFNADVEWRPDHSEALQPIAGAGPLHNPNHTILSSQRQH